MKEKMGISAGTDVIKEEDKEQIIAWAMKEANPLYPVPAVWDHDDFAKLLTTLASA